MAEYRSKVADDGRLVIPPSLRAALGVKPGDEVILSLEGGELRVFAAEGLRRAQMMVRKYIPQDRRLADELIAERRREAATVEAVGGEAVGGEGGS